MITTLIPALALVALLVLALMARRREDVFDGWKEAARQLHLELQPGGLLKTGTIMGPVKGMFVRVESFPRGRGDKMTPYTRIVVDGTDEIPESLIVVARATGGNHFPALPARRVPTHDARFDAEIFVLGDEQEVAALFTQSTRHLVSYTVPSLDVVVRRSEVYFEGEGIIEDPYKLVSTVRNLASLGAALRLDANSVCRRMAANSARDPMVAVRVHLLELLWSHFRSDLKTQEAVRHALKDNSFRVQLRAATLMGEEGQGHAESIARNPVAPEEVRVLALQWLAGHLPRERMGPLLAGVLSTRSEKVLLMVLDELGRLRWVPVLDRLLALLDNAEPDLEARIFEALKQMNDPEVEEALVERALNGSESGQRAALRTLGLVGGQGSVEPLMALAESVSIKQTTRELVREQVSEIVQRTGVIVAGKR